MTKKEIAQTSKLSADSQDESELTELDMGNKATQADTTDNADTKVQEWWDKGTQVDNVNTEAKAQEDEPKSQGIPTVLIEEDRDDTESEAEVQLREELSRTQTLSTETANKDDNGKTMDVSPDQKSPTMDIDFKSIIDLTGKLSQ